MLTTHPFDDDKLHEECGVFAVFDHPDAAALTALGLHALQHRGQEAAGIVAFDGEQFYSHRALGQVGDIFGAEEVMQRLAGTMAVGHTRYSTTGDTIVRNVQPLFVDYAFGGLAIGHNGNLTNAITLRRELALRGSIFHSTTDTEVISHLVATSSQNNLIDRLVDALQQVEGAYSLVAMSRHKIMGVRDPMGVRPLVLGHLDGAHILASETCALDIIGAEFVRDVAPGELVVIDADGVHTLRPFKPVQERFCVFEYIYFARPDSVVEGTGVYDARKRIGAELARESGVPADVVVPVPDSGVPAALGYAAQAGIPFEYGIIRNHYIGRTFIEPEDHIRHLGVRLKHNANRAQITGQRVVLVDDSIVRGTTSRKIVEMLRRAGAREVHMRISSPPTTHSCFYGIDTPEREQLLAAQHSIEEMARLIDVDSLVYLSLEGLYKALGGEPRFCDACFTGNYPTALIDRNDGGEPAQLSLLAEIA